MLYKNINVENKKISSTFSSVYFTFVSSTAVKTLSILADLCNNCYIKFFFELTWRPKDFFHAYSLLMFPWKEKRGVKKILQKFGNPKWQRSFSNLDRM